MFKATIDNVLNLCGKFLEEKEMIGELNKGNIDKHFYNAEAFLRNIFEEDIYNQNKFEEYMAPKIQRYEYSKGILSSNRGYYNPDPVGHLYINNEKRGRLLKCKQRPKDLTKYDYEYGFNSENKLIKIFFNGGKASDYKCESTEYILYGINYSISFEYNWLKKQEAIEGIAICNYDINNILQQIYHFRGAFEDEREYYATNSSIVLKDYVYTNKNKLTLHTYNHFGSSGRYGRMTSAKSFEFEIDKDGNYKYNGYGSKEDSYIIKAK